MSFVWAPGQVPRRWQFESLKLSCKPTLKAAGTSEYGGKTYYFCGKGCKAKFDLEPARYVEESGIGDRSLIQYVDLFDDLIEQSDHPPLERRRLDESTPSVDSGGSVDTGGRLRTAG